jgi:hypothetical protein
VSKDEVQILNKLEGFVTAMSTSLELFRLAFDTVEICMFGCEIGANEGVEKVGDRRPLGIRSGGTLQKRSGELKIFR